VACETVFTFPASPALQCIAKTDDRHPPRVRGGVKWFEGVRLLGRGIRRDCLKAYGLCISQSGASIKAEERYAR